MQPNTKRPKKEDEDKPVMKDQSQKACQTGTNEILTEQALEAQSFIELETNPSAQSPEIDISSDSSNPTLPGDVTLTRSSGRQTITLETATEYLNLVRAECADEPHIYNALLECLENYQKSIWDSITLQDNVTQLFNDRVFLLQEFKKFLPSNEITSLYRPLSFKSAEIRILKLAPINQAKQPLSCTMTSVPLSKAPAYTALSYQWGDQTQTVAAMINEIQVQITVNLDAALRRLVREGVNIIWADALCINQEDALEKSVQIPRMGAIFRRASSVAIWLGEFNHVENEELDLFTKAASSSTASDGCKLSFRAFTELLKADYWQRVWIVQELAVASSITLYYATSRLPWQSLCCICPKCRDDSMMTDVIGRQPNFVDSTIWKFYMLRNIRAHQLSRKPLSLMNLLYRTKTSLSTDPRDKLYALLGLAYDGTYLIPEPTYILSAPEVFVEFTANLINSGEALDLIYLRSGSRQNTTELPSWVPDWTDLGDRYAREVFQHIVEPSAKSARARQPVYMPTDTNVTVQDRELTAKGIRLQEVVTAGRSSRHKKPISLEDGDPFWAHGETCEGDVVVLLCRCSRPVVLRRLQTTTEKYQLIGDAEHTIFDEDFPDYVRNQPERTYQSFCIV